MGMCAAAFPCAGGMDVKCQGITWQALVALERMQGSDQQHAGCCKLTRLLFVVGRVPLSSPVRQMYSPPPPCQQRVLCRVPPAPPTSCWGPLPGTFPALVAALHQLLAPSSHDPPMLAPYTTLRLLVLLPQRLLMRPLQWQLPGATAPAAAPAVAPGACQLG